MVTFDNNNWSAEIDIDSNVLTDHHLATNNGFYAGVWNHITADADELTVEVKF